MSDAGTCPDRRIAVMDFLRFEQRPGLPDLLSGDGWIVAKHFDPISEMSEKSTLVSLPELADSYTQILMDCDDLPKVLVAVCAAAKLGSLVVGKLRESGRDVRCVFVDPSWASRAELMISFDWVLASLDAKPLETTVRNRWGNDQGGPLVERMTELLSGSILEALAAKGRSALADVVIPTLLGRYRAWFGFLAESEQTEPDVGIPAWAIAEADIGHPDWWPQTWHCTQASGLDDCLAIGDPATTGIISRIILDAATARI